MIPFSTHSEVGLTNNLKRLREHITDSYLKHCTVTEEAVANWAHKSGMRMVQSLAKKEKILISQWTQWGQRMQAQEAAHVNTWSHERVCGLFNMTLCSEHAQGSGRKRGWQGKQSQSMYAVLKESRLLPEGIGRDIIRSVVLKANLWKHQERLHWAKRSLQFVF